MEELHNKNLLKICSTCWEYALTANWEPRWLPSLLREVKHPERTEYQVAKRQPKKKTQNSGDSYIPAVCYWLLIRFSDSYSYCLMCRGGWIQAWKRWEGKCRHSEEIRPHAALNLVQNYQPCYREVSITTLWVTSSLIIVDDRGKQQATSVGCYDKMG